MGVKKMLKKFAVRVKSGDLLVDLDKIVIMIFKAKSFYTR